MNTPSLRLALIAGLTGMAAALPAAALTYTVGTGGTYSTIQAAINAAIAHPGDDDVRVHTGAYNESLFVGASMSADKLDVSGGWEDGFFSQAIDGAINTFVSPGINQRGALLQPAGGRLTVSELHFYGAAINNGEGAGVRVVPANAAVVTLFHDIFQENVVQTTNTTARGGALSVIVGGSAGVNVLGCDFFNNGVAVGSGSDARGAAINLQCSGSATCTLLDNTFRQHSAQAPGTSILGGAVNIELYQSGVLQFDRNTIEQVTVDGTSSFPTQGRSLRIFATDSAVALARGNRVLAALSSGQSASEVELSTSLQSGMTFSDSLVAKSGTRGISARLFGSGNAYLTNLTLADNLVALSASATSTGQPYLANSILTNTPNGSDLLPVVFTSNRIGAPVAFLAASLNDYSLRRADAAVTDAGNDVPQGGLGVLDISNGARIRGPHVDIGAWESSDRIFADRVDP